MKGLVFGNSHVAALYMARGKQSGLALDFYAISGGAGPSITVQDGRIYPADSKMTVQGTIADAVSDGLGLTGYDYVLFASLGLAAVRAEFGHIYRQYVLAGLGQPQEDTAGLLSQALAEQVALASLRRQPGVKALKQLAELYKGPIYCAPRPLPVRACIGLDHPLAQIYGDNLEAFLRWCGGVQMRTNRMIVQELRPGVVALDVPDLAWIEAGGTPRSYVVGGDPWHKNIEHDPWHMNAEYGGCVLQQLQQALFQSGLNEETDK